ncbi:MAG: hypothetical protein AAB490_02675, partial [Patescibacteria group bacterium]
YGLVLAVILTRTDMGTQLGALGCIVGPALLFGAINGLMRSDSPEWSFEFIELGVAGSAIVAVVAGPFAGLLALLAYLLPWSIAFGIVFLIARLGRWIGSRFRIPRSIA